MYKIIILITLEIFSCNTKSYQENLLQKKLPAIIQKDTTAFDYQTKISELKRVLSNDFTISTYSSFVIVSNLGSNETEKIIGNTIASAEKCFYNNYFSKKPDEITTIFLFKDDKSYRYWANKLFGDTDLSRFGYYKPSQKTMLMNINTGTGTLVHEMTHAFVRYDFPDIPSWFNEGLGSLYERSSLGDEILGYVNWRLPELQDAINNKTYTSLDILVNTNDDTFYGDYSSYNYAQARYLCLYLQEKNLLKKFYKAFRDNCSKDNTGKTYLEEVTKMKLADLDVIYVDWVKTLKYE